jgi:hypothetical protein
MSHYNLHSLEKAICIIQSEVGNEKNMRDVEKGDRRSTKKERNYVGYLCTTE